MEIVFDNIFSVTELNQQTANTLKKIKESGSGIIMKNNKPQYVILTYDEYKKLLEK